MKFNLFNFGDLKKHSSIKGLFCFKEDKEAQGKCLCENLEKAIIALNKTETFRAQKGEVYVVNYMEDLELNKTILVGLGEKEKFDVATIRNNTGKLIKAALAEKAKVIDIHLIGLDKKLNYDMVKAIVEASIMTNYKFDKYKTDKSEGTLEEINIVFNEGTALENIKEAVKEGEILGEGNLIARALVNEPANVLTPGELSRQATALGEKYGFNTKIYSKKDIENLNMNAFLAVGRGSVNEPKLIVMRYEGNPENKEEILGLVGKGITFDAGGYCLKTAGNMWQMKSDMGGAGAVVGAMTAIARMKLKKNVIAVIAACDNLISGDAYKPGDIISTMNGKTIEIINTDAEGRLTLVDAVTYIIRKEKVSRVIDIATLTGAVGGAIGNIATGVVDNNAEFYSIVEEASYKCDEKVWRFPNFEEYKELLKVGNADLVNSTGPIGGGAITAGLFIGEFVEEKPWIHLDIAAGAFAENPKKEYLSKGATGIGTRLLYEVAKLI